MAYQWMYFMLIFSWNTFSSEAGPDDWLLYSNDRINTDCLLVNYRDFCRVIHQKNHSEQTVLSCVHGKLWSFSELQQNRVTVDELLNWLIPFEIIEQYADYLSFNSVSFNNNTTICNCTMNRIGARCEYELMSRSTSSATVIRDQLGNNVIRDEELPTSIVNDMPCDAGVLDLEWRQVCDGIINCEDAVDEQNCYLLEFNQCDSDEFQCRNGICIPKEFLFDGAPDCMDSSDEQELREVYELYAKCSTRSASECDERLCRRDEFSCGNGQCVNWSAIINHQNSCSNLRNVVYLCDMIDFSVTKNIIFKSICNRTSSPLFPLFR
jgi:hypothetical protein